MKLSASLEYDFENTTPEELEAAAEIIDRVIDEADLGYDRSDANMVALHEIVERRIPARLVTVELDNPSKPQLGYCVRIWNEDGSHERTLRS